jgi:O-antigen ligase
MKKPPVDLTAPISHTRLIERVATLGVMAALASGCLVLPIAEVLQRFAGRFSVFSPLAVVLNDPESIQWHVLLMTIVTTWGLVLAWRLICRDAIFDSFRSFDAWVTAFAVCIVVSSATSPDRAYSVSGAMHPLGLIALYALAIRGTMRRSDADRTFAIIVALSVFLSAIGCLQFFGWDVLSYRSEVQQTKHTVVSTLGHANFLASFIGPSLFLIPLVGRSRGAWGFRALSGAIVFVCLVLTGARGAWLGVLAGAVGFGAFAIRMRPDVWKRGLLVAGAIAIFSVALVSVPGVSRRLSLRERVASGSEVSTRLFYWTVAARMFAEHPALGVGYHRFSSTFWDEALRMTREEENAPIREYLLHAKAGFPGEAHNEYIEIAAEMGIVGLAILTGMLAWFATRAVGAYLSNAYGIETRFRLLCIGCALAASAIDALFGFPWQLPASGALFWTLLAVLGNETLRSDGAITRATRPARESA